jgi:hypothetical protein
MSFGSLENMPDPAVAGRASSATSSSTGASLKPAFGIATGTIFFLSADVFTPTKLKDWVNASGTSAIWGAKMIYI